MVTSEKVSKLEQMYSDLDAAKPPSEHNSDQERFSKKSNFENSSIDDFILLEFSWNIYISNTSFCNLKKTSIHSGSQDQHSLGSSFETEQSRGRSKEMSINERKKRSKSVADISRMMKTKNWFEDRPVKVSTGWKSLNRSKSISERVHQPKCFSINELECNKRKCNYVAGLKI